LGHPRGAVPHEDRLDEVLAVATRLFRENGFRGTRLGDIADALGVTRAALYYYFDGKRELLEEICARSMASTEHALLSVQELDDPADRLVSFAKVYAGNMTSDAARVFWRDSGELEPSSRRALMARAHAVNDGAEAVFQYGVGRGDFSSEIDLRHATLGFLGMLNSLAEWYRPSRDGDLGDTVADLVSIFVSGVRTRDTAPAPARRKRKTA
jgi:AcrR family transcriptional regulator